MKGNYSIISHYHMHNAHNKQNLGTSIFVFPLFQILGTYPRQSKKVKLAHLI